MFIRDRQAEVGEWKASNFTIQLVSNPLLDLRGVPQHHHLALVVIYFLRAVAFIFYSALYQCAWRWYEINVFKIKYTTLVTWCGGVQAPVMAHLRELCGRRCGILAARLCAMCRSGWPDQIGLRAFFWWWLLSTATMWCFRGVTAQNWYPKIWAKFSLFALHCIMAYLFKLLKLNKATHGRLKQRKQTLPNFPNQILYPNW